MGNGLRLISIFFFIFFLPVNVVAAIDNSSMTVKWGYKGNIGPARWGQLSNDFELCTKGKEQSPINILKATPTAFSLKVHYQRAPLEIMRDGATLLTLGKEQALVNTGHGIQVDFHHEDREYIVYQQANYELIQFHLHTPSETQLRGEAYPLEIHFVHQGAEGRVAVIGVFVKAGKANPILEKIIQHLPEKDGKEHLVAGQRINPLGLLPAEQNYYSFSGSLTTPPCDEGLDWIMMEEAITASTGQIAALRHAMGGANARPVQALNDRQVMYAKQGLVARATAYLNSWLLYTQN